MVLQLVLHPGPPLDQLVAKFTLGRAKGAIRVLLVMTTNSDEL